MLPLQFGALQNALKRIEDVTTVGRCTEDRAVLIDKVPVVSVVLVKVEVFHAVYCTTGERGLPA
jgi:hypothetical protein